VPTVLNSGSLILLQPSGPVQACNGIALLYRKSAMTDRKLSTIRNIGHTIYVQVT